MVRAELAGQPPPVPGYSCAPYQDYHYHDHYYMAPQDMCPQHQQMCAMHPDYGPVTVPMVSTNASPPMGVQVQVPPGHVLQQIVDESGTLRHVILSAQPPHMPHQQHMPHANMPPNHHYGPANGGNAQPQFYSQGGYPHPVYHSPPTPLPPPPPPPHLHQPPPLPAPPSQQHSYHKDERAQRQYVKLKRKFEQKHPRHDSLGRYNSGHSTPAALSPRKEFANGGIRSSSSTMGGTSSEGEGSSSAATSVQGDEEDSQPLFEYLSSLQTPQVSDVTARSALVQWSSPVAEEGMVPAYSGEMRYELLLGEKGRYKAIYSGPSLSCRVQDLRPGTEYAVCLQAHADGLTGAASQAAILRTPPCEPGAPSPPRLPSRTRSSLQLRWTAPQDNGSHILHYVLQFDEGKNAPYVDLCKPYAKQHNLQKLEPSTAYKFRIAAVNEVGQGPWSDEVAFTTCGIPPSVPDPPCMSRVESTAIHLHWAQRPEDKEFSLQYEDAYIRRGTFLVAYQGPKTEYVCENLVRFSDYKFRLQALNEEGGSRWSDEVVYRTLPECPAAPPKPFVKGKIHAQFFRIRWIPPLDTGGANIEYYVVEIKTGLEYEEVYRGAEVEALCDNLQPATTYQVRVCCVTAGGTSAWSELQTITTEPVTPVACSAPRLLAEPRPHSAALHWERPDYDGGSPILEYNVEITEEERSRLVYSGKETECTVQELLPGRRYSFRVKAFNRVGSGPWSEHLTITSGAAPPEAPTPPQLTVKSPYNILVQWEEPACNGGPILEYHLEMKEGNDDGFVSIFQGAQLTYDVKTLLPYTCYTFRVCAFNKAGGSEWSEGGKASTPGSAPGSPPTVNANVTATDCALTWSEPPSNGSDILYYRIDTGDKLLLTDGPTLDYNLDNLQPETTYRVRIQAVNDIGIGNFSPTLKVSTLPPPPDAPTLTCSQHGHNFLKLKWGDGKNPDFTHYIVEMQNPRRKEYQIVYQGTSMAFRVKKLQESSLYRFRICASNDAGGQGEFSEDVEFETTAAPPATLKVPRLLELQEHSAVVEWSAPRLPAEEPLLYVVQCCRTKDQEYKQVYKGPETSTAIQDLEGGCEYCVRVCAERENGLQGGWSPGLLLTPPASQLSPTSPQTSSVPRRAPRKPAAPTPMSDNHYALILLFGFLCIAIMAAIAVEHFIDWRNSN